MCEGPFYYKLIGRLPVPVSPEEWLHRKGNQTVDTVGYECIGSVQISTVFLDIDFSRLGEKPTLFETMILWAEGHPTIIVSATWDEAEQNHAMAVRLAHGVIAEAEKEKGSS